MKAYKDLFRDHLCIVFAALSIILIVFVTYSYICNYFFTTADALTLIETSRIQSPADIVRIFTEPIMSHTTFESLAKYYRPIAVLSYSIDYFIWKLNPVGYHLTNLIIHIIVTLSVFFLIYTLTSRYLSAWLAAIIFAIHPIHIEVIPAIARRQETMATLFTLLAFLFFLKYLRSISHKMFLLSLSAFSYFLALGSKEAGILFLPLIFIYLMIFAQEKNLIVQFIQITKKCIPFIILTSIYLICRIYIIGGIGGYSRISIESSNPSMVIQSAVKIIAMYIVNLFYSIDFLISKLLFNYSLSISIFVILLFLPFFFLFFYGHKKFNLQANRINVTVKIFKVILLISIIISVTGLLASSLISSFINQMIPEMSLGEKIALIKHAMEVRYPLPPDAEFSELFLRLLFFVLLSVSVICLILIHQYKPLKNYFTGSPQGKLVGFFLIWLLMPLCLYLPTLTFTHPNMYSSIIPFSASIAIILYDGLQYIAQQIKKKGSINKSRVFTISLVTALVVSNFSYSPLVKTYRDWEVASSLYLKFFHELSKAIPELPDNTTIYIYNLPQLIFSSKAKIPRIQTATYLTDYSIKSWLDLNYPNNNIKVVSINRGGIFTDISDIKIEIDKNNHIVNIFIHGKRIN